MPPLISVIIPLYNHEKFIYEAVVSVLEQSYVNLELIIIDDGSIDNSVATVSTLSDSRLKLFTQQNCGAHATINRGIASAKGDYVAILNSDDLYHSTRLQTFVDVITEDKTIDALFSQVEAIHENSEHYFSFSNRPKHNIPLKRDHPDQRLAADLLGINIVTTTSNLFCKKEVFNDIGLFRNYRYSHDLDFFLRLFQQKHVRFIDKPLLCYRIHATNTLKEDSAMVYFETAIVLADFLQNQTPMQLFPGVTPDQAHAHLFSALNIHHIDRVLQILLQYHEGENSWQEIRDRLLQDKSHPFRITCLQYIQESLAHEENQKSANKRFKQLSATIEKLKHENRLYQKSTSHRIGRCCTWPVRKFLGTFTR
ncbi:MAG: glycosyltransferase [Proteobacteria bacterium]|nr:glycosyltransferase [Pseudomonadota bacterium]